jgi:hypothetical protein
MIWREGCGRWYRSSTGCRISLYRFDNEFETAFEAKDSGDINREDCLLVPRGATALNDAIVKSLSAIEARILKEEETERPDLVVIAVITDGHENASTEVKKKADVQEAIKRASDKFGWQFAYLAADDKGFDEGSGYMHGVRGSSVASFSSADAGSAPRRYSTAVKNLRSNMGSKIDIKD